MMSQVRRTFSLLNQRACSWSWFRSSSSSRLLTDSGSTGLVLQSQSTDVYQNLALEDWIDANVDLQGCGVLLLWRNQPAVVIGRHQNPWTECNLPAMRRAGISLARRRSGGGTVFHDLGNLNLTFFASKKAYDRQRNLKVVTEALRRLCPGLDVQATDRFDIILNGCYKISGTASRLSRKSSYHHCTLLHSADRSALSSVLRPSCPGIQSNATPSVPSPVANLIDHAPSLQWEELLDALVQQTPAHRSAHLRMEVKSGRIESCQLDVPADWLPVQLSGELSGVLLGERFCPHRAAAAFSALLRSESGESYKRLHHLCDAVLTAMG
ncbi:lipoyl amidotransferase LIPT1, mitochondrial isoform X2 [Archocentrus centrarchus]|uniref:lipoyl amidotransferase LIPT1, mitochondrial isoform X2 n=1 Tax=Archocentrus centrarchus TaxID=63155 RepID=UPI0011E9FD14|nr:lipoyltransferase 1, mitochondrial isoform X2 [Archocentrus centrarchus]